MTNLKQRMNYFIDSISVVNHHPFQLFLCSLKMSCKSISPLFYPRHRDSCRVTAPNRESIGATRRAHWSQRATWYLLQLNLGLPIKTTKNARLGTWHLVKIVLTPTWPLLALWPPAPIVRWKPNENMSGPSPPSFYLHYHFAAALTKLNKLTLTLSHWLFCTLDLDMDKDYIVHEKLLHGRLRLRFPWHFQRYWFVP